MTTPEQKQDWREKYLERMRKQSEVTDFLPLIKAVGTDSFEDHVVGFISDTLSPIIANLVFYLETRDAADNCLGQLNEFCENPIDILEQVQEYSEYDIEELDKDVQEYYCLAIKQLFYAFRIINSNYKADEITIVKQILSNTHYPFILRDLERLIYIIANYLPEKLYTQEDLGDTPYPVDVLLGRGLWDFRYGEPLLNEHFFDVIISSPESISIPKIDGAKGLINIAIPWGAIWEAIKTFFASKIGKATILALIDIIKHWIKKKITARFRKKKEDEKNKGAGDEDEKPGIQDIRSVLGEMNGDDEPPIVPGLIQEKEFVCIFGKEKVGKSFLGIQISCDAAMGGRSSLFPQLECSIPKSNVYYYASEGRRDKIGKRFPDEYFDFHPNYHLLLADGQNCSDVICHFKKTVKKQILSGSHNLWVIDNLTSLAGNKVRSGVVDVFIDRIDSLMRLASKKDAVLTVLLFAHSNVSGDAPFASDYIKKRATNIIRYAKDPSDNTKRTLSIEVASKYYENNCYSFKSVQDGKDRVHYEVITPTTTEQKTECASQIPEEKEAKEESKEAIIIRLAREGKTKTEIHKETGISRPTINRYWPKDLPSKPDKSSKKSE